MPTKYSEGSGSIDTAGFEVARSARVQRKPKLADAIVPYLVTRLKDPVSIIDEPSTEEARLYCSSVQDARLMIRGELVIDATYLPFSAVFAQEWEVRGKAAKELCDVAAKSLELLSAGTIKDLAERSVHSLYELKGLRAFQLI